MIILHVTAEIVEVPLRHVFATSRDTLTKMVSRTVVITVELEDGRKFYGEAVPVEYVTGETPESVLEAIRKAVDIEFMDVLYLQPILYNLQKSLPNAPSARAGIEMAVYAAHAAVLGQPLWMVFGGAIQSVETDITLPIVPDVLDRAMEAAERGFRQFKMKVGSEDHLGDLERLIAIHLAIPSARFRLDANQAFTEREALAFVDKVLEAGVNLAFVEQPVPKEDLAALDRVAASCPVPVIADEAVESPADALRIVRETRVQGINIKLMKAGIAGALDIIAIARAAGLKLMLGCMLETRRGISYSLALACGTNAFDYIDLDSHLLLKEEGENPYFLDDGPILRLNESS
jgi:L-alanine-DL-glutamate epimerase-like enolase superfamily enzyme